MCLTVFKGLLWPPLAFLIAFFTLGRQSFGGFPLQFHQQFPGCQICHGTDCVHSLGMISCSLDCFISLGRLQLSA